MRLVLCLVALLGCSRRVVERVYVSDEDGGVVVVIDAATEKVVGRVAVGKRPRGLQVSPDGTRLYVALSGSPKAPPGVDPSTLPAPDRSADGIGVIDLGAMTLTRVIHAGQDPEVFDVTRDGRRMWVSNEETAEASLVDIESGQVVKRAAVGVEPEGVAIHPSGHVVYVTNEEDDTISVLDAETADPVATIPVCDRPRALVFAAGGARAFVSCENSGSLGLLDARAHRSAGELELPGQGVRPMGLVLSPDGGTLYATGGRGKTVHVISVAEDPPRVLSTIEDAGARPWGIGLSRKGGKLFTANGPSGDVSVIDTKAGKVVRRIDVGGSPWGVAVR